MATAKVIIKGENQIGSAVKSAQSDLTGFSQAAQKAGEFLKKAFTVTAVIAALKKLGDACTACFNDFSQANRAYKQLSLSMKDQSAYKSVIANIGKLSRQTLSSKSEIEAMVSELAALGKSADEINRISDAAVALSNVTGKDLNSSMTTLLNTYNGTTKQLNKLGIDTSNLTKHQLENGAAVDVVIQKFGKLSQAMAEADTSQHIQNIKNTWGDIKQQIGGILDYNFGPMFADLDNGLNQSFFKITGVINYIGAVIANFREVLSRTMTLLGEIILRIFSWDFISGSVETSFQNILTLIGGVFTALEKATGGFFSWRWLMISSTVITEGSDISELDEVFAKINAQANGTEKVEYEQAFVFFAENEPVFFYSQPENGQVINLKRGKAAGNFDLMKIKPSYGCIAAVLLPKAYKSIPSEVYRNALQSEDTEEHIYNLRQDCMYCDGERIGMLGFPNKGIMKFTFCGNEQLRGDSIGTIKTLVKTFLEVAQYED